ncbi:MAG: type II toxin-antitoxin system VapC family toxin [Bifidobacteriaceae bacterium]|jgi:predicted nucleic acid-binding protein|nr:type II toxin-antitoxin system VapC family toxin [Bifidobacteriaceae bacterium]
MAAYYLDTSVFLHWVAKEGGAVAWLDGLGRGEELFSSTLLRLEAIRSVRRAGTDPSGLEPYFARVALVDLDQPVLSRAESLPGSLRALDAIHLATAGEVPGAVMVSHDKRLKDAAAELGTPVLDPVA